VSDYRVEIKVRNERVLKALRGLGHTPSSFAKERGLDVGAVCRVASMSVSPKLKNGMWRKEVMALAEAANVMPEEMFTAKQMEGSPRRADFAVSESQLMLQANEFERLAIEAEDPVDGVCMRDLAARLLSDLARENPRYAKAYDVHLKGGTLREVGREIGVSVERARQVVFSAERKMRTQAVKRYGVKDLSDILAP
jgi:hypothetical protein